MSMKELGRALAVKYPGRQDDYILSFRNGKVEIDYWNLPEPKPKNDGQARQIINGVKEKLEEQEARQEPDWPSLEERVTAVEEKLAEMGHAPPTKTKRDELLDRVKNRGR